jgi:hypothetical protein
MHPGNRSHQDQLVAQRIAALRPYLDMLNIVVDGFDETATGSLHALHDDDNSLGFGWDRPI